jgi:hypothetical protein
MAGKPRDRDAGATKTVCVSLTPPRLVRLDNEAKRLGITRSALVSALVDVMRYNPGVPVDVPPGAEMVTDSDGTTIHHADGTRTRLVCPHPKTFPYAGARIKCVNCGAVRQLDGTWSTP